MKKINNMREFYRAMADGETIQRKYSDGWVTTYFKGDELQKIEQQVEEDCIRIKPKEINDTDRLQWLVDNYTVHLEDGCITFPDGSSIAPTPTPKPKILKIMIRKAPTFPSGYAATVKGNSGQGITWIGWQEHEIEWREE